MAHAPLPFPSLPNANRCTHAWDFSGGFWLVLTEVACPVQSDLGNAVWPFTLPGGNAVVVNGTCQSGYSTHGNDLPARVCNADGTWDSSLVTDTCTSTTPGAMWRGARAAC